MPTRLSQNQPELKAARKVSYLFLSFPFLIFLRYKLLIKDSVADIGRLHSFNDDIVA